MNEYTEEYKALSRARVELLNSSNTVFLSTVCFSLKHSFSYDVPTAGTNGTDIIYNPDFWNKQSPQQQLGLMLHEVYHVILDHCSAIVGSRATGKNPKLFNIAADFVINGILDNTGIKLPDNGCLDHKYDDMTTEQVYACLLQDPKYQNLKDVDLDILPVKGDIKEHQRVLEDLLMQAAMQALVYNDNLDSIPEHIKVRINDLTNPKLPWDRLLIRYFNTKSKQAFNYLKPNRRFMRSKTIIPSRYSESLGNVAMAIDMSGSVSDKETTQFLSDITYVINKLKLSNLNLVQFDTTVFAVDQIKKASDILQVDLKGRGGTIIDPVMAWGKENTPDVLIICSDGYFHPPSINPNVPVLWVIHNNPQFTAPFGEVIHYTI